VKKLSSVTRRSFLSNTRGHGRALIWLSAVNFGLLIALYIIESRTAERHWLGTLITYAPQHFYCLPSLILLAWAGFRKNGRAMAINLAALAFFGTALLGFCVPWRAEIDGLGGPHAQRKHIRVMTYNIHHSQNGGILVADEIRKAKPDVVFLQEANALLDWSSAVSEFLHSDPSWRLIDYGELAILSRYPIKEHAISQMEWTTGRIIVKAVLDVEGRSVTVIDVHLNSSLRSGLTDFRGVSLADRLNAASRTRLVQLDALLNVTRRIPGPLIVAGDFNTPPRGELYRRMSARLTDAFGYAGWGVGYTFRSDVPAMRIDYVFLGNGVRAERCWAPHTQVSDHLPLVADVELPR